MPVISEVAWGGTSASASDEWIEIYNPGETAVELAGWRLSGLDGTPDIMLQGSLAPGAYFLLERTDDTTISDVVADQIYSGALGNTDEGLALWDASGTLVDTANGDGGDWPAGSASPEHQSMERTGLTESDSDVNWHSNQGSIRNGLDAGGNPIQGTPRQPNSPPTQLEPTPTPEPTYSPTSEPTSQPTPYPANISLNEFMPDPATDWNQDGSVNTNDEYVELFNANDVPVDLSGWLLDDVDDYLAKSGMPQGSQPYHLPDGTYIPPRGFLLLFRGQTGIALNNDDDWVRLLHPDGSLVEATQYDSSHDDQAYSKTEDGGFQWTQSFPPSPGTSNQPPPTPTPTPTPTTGTLGGFVFEDVDGDGRYEPWAGEPGISGVLVTLSNGFSRLTGDSGFYGWRNLLSTPEKCTIFSGRKVYHFMFTDGDRTSCPLVTGDSSWTAEPSSMPLQRTPLRGSSLTQAVQDSDGPRPHSSANSSLAEGSPLATFSEKFCSGPLTNRPRSG